VGGRNVNKAKYYKGDLFLPTGLNGEKKRMSPGLQLVENTTEETEEKEQNKTSKNRVCP